MNVLQYILNRSVTAILEQGASSAVDDGEQITCVYRSEDGKRCAIGHLIKDDFYESRFEGESIENFAIQKALFLSLKNDVEELTPFNKDHIDFLMQIQRCHDDAAAIDNFTTLKLEDKNAVFIRKFLNNVIEIAAEHNLTVPS